MPKDGPRIAVELRNKTWITPALCDILRERNISLALIDHPWMPRPIQFLAGCDPLTAEFTYARLLGDRHKIEEQTKVWDKVIVDRTRELNEWINVIQRVRHRGVEMLIYVNNHFAGFAPEIIRQLKALLDETTPPKKENIAAAAKVRV